MYALQVDYAVDYRVDYGGGEGGLRGPHQPHDRLEGSFDQVFYNQDHFDYQQYQDFFWKCPLLENICFCFLSALLTILLLMLSCSLFMTSNTYVLAAIF